MLKRKYECTKKYLVITPACRRHTQSAPGSERRGKSEWPPIAQPETSREHRHHKLQPHGEILCKKSLDKTRLLKQSPDPVSDLNFAKRLHKKSTIAKFIYVDPHQLEGFLFLSLCQFQKV